MPMGDARESVFDLPERLRRKADRALIGRDERHFAALGAALAAEVERAEGRLAELQRETVNGGQRALERDLEVQGLAARVRILRRFGLDACIGRMVDDAGTVTYIGRFGLADAAEERLLMDWRAPRVGPLLRGDGRAPSGAHQQKALPLAGGADRRLLGRDLRRRRARPQCGTR